MLRASIVGFSTRLGGGRSGRLRFPKERFADWTELGCNLESKSNVKYFLWVPADVEVDCCKEVDGDQTNARSPAYNPLKGRTHWPCK